MYRLNKEAQNLFHLVLQSRLATEWVLIGIHQLVYFGTCSSGSSPASRQIFLRLPAALVCLSAIHNSDRFHPNNDRFHPNNDQFHHKDRFHPNNDGLHPNNDRFHLIMPDFTLIMTDSGYKALCPSEFCDFCKFCEFCEFCEFCQICKF